MKAVSRLGILLLAGALALAPASALAQEAPPSGTAPATDAVGPKDLQDFSLSGTVTHAADQPTVVVPQQQKRQQRSQAQAAGPEPQPRAAAAQAPSSSPAEAPAAPPRTETASADAPARERAPEPLRQSPPSSSVTVALPKLDSTATGGSAASSASLPASTPAFAPDPAPPATLGAEHGFSILPWLLAALALGAGGAFLFWRNRGREAFAGGPQIDAFTQPSPEPAPAPAPAPRPVPRPTPAPPVARGPAAAPAPAPAPAPTTGIVSTRLRPWIEIGFTPLRCTLEDERVIVEFDLELFNSGSAPARAVLVEATLFNAGPAQDQEIGAFFENPVGQGERIVVIPPLQRISVRTQVIAPRSQMQAYELGGRQVFVPLIAFNALYRWSGGEGQTSVSYLLGRDTKGEKMAPFRLDLGPRIFRGIAGRLLPVGVRA
jgi:hypothetical protein